MFCSLSVLLIECFVCANKFVIFLFMWITIFWCFLRTQDYSYILFLFLLKVQTIVSNPSDFFRVICRFFFLFLRSHLMRLYEIYLFKFHVYPFIVAANTIRCFIWDIVYFKTKPLWSVLGEHFLYDGAIFFMQRFGFVLFCHMICLFLWVYWFIFRYFMRTRTYRSQHAQVWILSESSSVSI